MTFDRTHRIHPPRNRPRELAGLSAAQKRLLNFFFSLTVIGTFLALLGITLYYIYAFAALSNGSHAFDWLLGIFSDFVAIMDFALSDSPYLEGGSSYPPLAIALLYPFARICCGVLIQYDAQAMSIDALTSRVIAYPQFWLALILFFLICSALIVLTVLKKYRLDPLSSIKLALIIILSTPFVYAIMRGNVIYFAFLFLSVFLLWYDHPSALLRELSYLFLAIAGMIKIYPLFFGVFLLHKKQWGPALRVALYFVLGTFLSFFLYQDGLGNLSPFLSHLGAFMNAGDRLLSPSNLSLSSTLCKLLCLFSPKEFTTVLFQQIHIFSVITVFLIATITASLTQSTLSRSVIAAGVVVLIPSISYFYVLIFFLIPFFEFLKSYEAHSKRKKSFYLLCFALLFFTPTILLKNFILHALTVIAMLGVEIWSVIHHELLPAQRQKKLGC